MKIKIITLFHLLILFSCQVFLQAETDQNKPSQGNISDQPIYTIKPEAAKPELKSEDKAADEGTPAHIVKIIRKFSGQENSELLDIDSTNRHMIVSLTSNKPFEAKLYYPDGKEVQAIPDKVTVQNFSSGVNYQIEDVPPGQWKVEAKAHASITVDIQSRTAICFEDFHFMDSIIGKNGFMDVKLERIARSGEKLKAIAIVRGGDAIKEIKEFQIRSTEGKVLKTINTFKKTGNDEYDLGKMIVPKHTSQIYVVGEDKSGNRFQRLFPQTIKGKTEE